MPSTPRTPTRQLSGYLGRVGQPPRRLLDRCRADGISAPQPMRTLIALDVVYSWHLGDLSDHPETPTPR
eukprot:9490820-Pyramimonas_sp.AAC.1